MNHTWHDFEGQRETLQSIIEGYLWHLNLHLKEIEELINKQDKKEAVPTL